MDLRPQAHEIIRTWLFSTMVRSELEHQQVPWAHAAISGWVLDPERKKMSKSKGNVVVPTELLEQHGTDAVRYWAAAARLGVDTAFDEQQMQVGRRLAIKILNASKFVLGRIGEADAAPVEFQPLDAALLARLADVIADATHNLATYEHARALDRSEQFFWGFCDDYLELVKTRAYTDGPGRRSAVRALATALEAILRLFAPFLPFCTEEAWSWWHTTSVHEAPWPTAHELGVPVDRPDPVLFDHVAQVLGEVRRAKTGGHLSMRAPVSRVVVRGNAQLINFIALARNDLVDAGGIEVLELVTDASEALSVEVEL
jgi:valyl-tRNA synthetase